MALSGADLPKLVQLFGSRLPKEMVPYFGPEPNNARKASLKFAKAHRTHERCEIRAKGTDCGSTPGSMFNGHNEENCGARK